MIFRVFLILMSCISLISCDTKLDEELDSTDLTIPFVGTYIGDLELETDLHTVSIENKRLKITKVDNRTIELYIHISSYRNTITLDENSSIQRSSISVFFDEESHSVTSVLELNDNNVELHETVKTSSLGELVQIRFFRGQRI